TSDAIGGSEPAFETMEHWRAYIDGSAGGLAVAAGRLLGAPEPESLRPLGSAYGIAGLLRSAATYAQQGCRMLPVDMPVEQLVEEGLALLSPVHLPRRAIAAALPAVLAKRDLRRAPNFPLRRGLGDRLAVTLAGLAGRI